MTQFVDVNSIANWIAKEGVENIIGGIVEYLERDYARWPRFHKIPRVGSHTPLGVIELMPTSDGEEYSFKYVNGHPSNPARGFQTVTAFGVLANVDNGYPTFLTEMTLLTALRTAAVSAMAGKHLARPDSQTMAMIGAGSQSEFQALGFRATLGIENIRIYDADPHAVAKFERNMAPLGFTVTACSSAHEACEGADVITTCTADQAQNQVLHDVDVPAGVHINAVGGDCPGKTELEPAILDRATVFVEFPEQTWMEGEIQNKPKDFPITEFWTVITGEHPGRRDAEEITMFDSVGFAVNDFSALRYLRDSTANTDLQTYIDLIADPEDPKDLFSLVPSHDRVL